MLCHPAHPEWAHQEMYTRGIARLLQSPQSSRSRACGVDVLGAASGNPGGECTEQGHGEDHGEQNNRIIGSGLIDDVGEYAAGEDSEDKSGDGTESKRTMGRARAARMS